MGLANSGQALRATYARRSFQPLRSRQTVEQPAAGGEGSGQGGSGAISGATSGQGASGATSGATSGQGGSGAGPSRPRREHVTFLVPGQNPLCVAHVRQRDLDGILAVAGAYGFEMPGGAPVSRSLDDLPEGGTVQLVLPSDPPMAEQVRNLQRADDNTIRGKEEEIGAFLRSHARAGAAGAPVIALQTTPFKDVAGQDYVQLDAAVVAGDTAYVGEFKRVLGEGAVLDLNTKVEKIRTAMRRGVSPSLAAALQGVTHVKLFLGGQVVRKGLPVHKLAEDAALAGMSLVLPSGQVLGLAAEPAPAVRL